MSTSAGSELQTAVVLLQAELTRLRDSSGEAWRSYMGWFTWFFTTQVVFVGWVITKTPDLSKVAETAVVMAAAFMMLNLLGVVQAARQRAYCELQRKRAEVICKQLSTCAEKSGLAVEITSGFASDLVDSALKVFAVVLSASAVMWLYVIVRLALAGMKAAGCLG
jgi:hypothetical protein